MRIIITADKQTAGSDGWLEFSDGTKQWLSPDCRALLESDGVSLAILPWAEIDAMPNGPQLPCEDLRPGDGTDVAAPDSVMVSPAANARTSAPVTLEGTATDNVGVTRVQLTIYQAGTTDTWNGSAFTTPRTRVDATLSAVGGSNITWSYDMVDVPAVRVVFSAAAFDAAGNVDPTRPWRLFTISDGDLEPPDSVTVSPTANSSISSPVVLEGTATDNVGVTQVQLTIYKAGTTDTWNGSAFTAPRTRVDASVGPVGGTNVSWFYEMIDAPPGRVVFSAAAFDAAGNVDPTRPWRLFTVGGGDTVAPDSVVVSPAQSSSVPSPVVLEGTASDNVGVTRVQLTIYEAGTIDTWNGSAFTADRTRVDATLDSVGGADVGWSYEMVGAPPVSVVFSAAAFDGAGNVDPTRPWRLFTVEDDGGAANLAMILANGTRNTQFDNNEFRGVPANQIQVADLTVPEDIYNDAHLDTTYSGYFRVKCEVSHFAYDDPIVFPNQPGRAHLHMFFGNTEAHAYSTFDSLLNSGTGTCNGEDLNRTAYWVPAMLDGDGNALIPFEIMVYYKNDNYLLQGANELVDPFPNNLRMIAGNAAATSPQTTPSGNPGSLPVVSFNCGPAYQNNQLQPLIPDCSGNANSLEMKVAFRQCFNEEAGTYLADQSHVSYSEGGYYGIRCPASHPTDLSSIMYRIFYRPAEYGGSLTGLHLSSDIKPDQILPGGTTSHADWFGAWHPEAMAMWIENCNNTQNDCELGLLSRDPEISLVERQRYFYPYGYRAPAEELIKLCPGKQLDQSDRLRSVASCRMH
ncbi:MAG: DUF1996 domain-containing protein [Acidimicrobiales bacterium]